jgi:hypothetical protein
MKHSEQVRLIHAAFAAIERGTPPLADRCTTNDPWIYASAERAAREREVLFRRHPIVAGFSADLPSAGDFITDSLGPVPIPDRIALIGLGTI